MNIRKFHSTFNTVYCSQVRQTCYTRWPKKLTHFVSLLTSWLAAAQESSGTKLKILFILAGNYKTNYLYRFWRNLLDNLAAASTSAVDVNMKSHNDRFVIGLGGYHQIQYELTSKGLAPFATLLHIQRQVSEWLQGLTCRSTNNTPFWKRDFPGIWLYW